MEIIAQGAEAVIKTDGTTVVKERVPKAYRHPQIDSMLRKLRTRKEAKIIEKLQNIVPCPKLINVDEETKGIEMEFVHGEKLRDVLEKLDYKELCRIVGRQVGILHSKNIIHGDLTTSNMILKDRKIFFIDFGLSFESHKVEDKAVDLYLLRQALNSKHYSIPDAFGFVLEGYSPENKAEVLERLKQAELRGRNKHK
jgi:TP53 regulating kinase-like protein